MTTPSPISMLRRTPLVWKAFGLLVVGVAAACVSLVLHGDCAEVTKEVPADESAAVTFAPRQAIDTGGFVSVGSYLPSWRGDSLEEVATQWHRAGPRALAELSDRHDLVRRAGSLTVDRMVRYLLEKAALYHYEGKPEKAAEVLSELRAFVQGNSTLDAAYRYTVIYFQGVTALRQGETDNCVLCRGESSCILPIVPAAVHTKPAGSKASIGFFTEYLARFPDDLEVKWLLNIAHMTLGEHPARVDPQYLISLDRYNSSEFGIGKFRDVGHLLGINRFNQAGGAVMDDFDNDGLLDLVFTSWDPTEPMVFYRNRGDGTFEDRTAAAGLKDQLGGINCVQTDYNNDGFLDLFVIRGGWFRWPIRPSLLRNNGNGTFTDVTTQAGIDAPVNSIAAAWADYDNDGFLDLFICCERQPNRLYRNRGDGTFEETAAAAGVAGKLGDTCKGVAWIDYDNDGYPDLFLNNLDGTAALYHNNRNGTFTNVTQAMGINGPTSGFACWAWDFDNDGWPDIFATSYERTTEDVVRGLTGQPHFLGKTTNRLYRNLQGKGFQDVTAETGLNQVFATMGCNFADFDNDGYLDMYLGTGDPQISTLIPNRMFRNLGGKRFVDITGSSGTGHLQKGHGVACGDWDRDGNIDIAMEVGGAIPGDRYHNVMFQNPGQGNRSIAIKLVGKKTNRAAIGARIKVVTAGEHPLTVYRHVSSGGSFGANPLEQTIGVGKAERIAMLEIYWPTSGTTHVFHNVPVGEYLVITEFAETYQTKKMKSISLPR